jgi:hypothetical protein
MDGEQPVVVAHGPTTLAWPGEETAEHIAPDADEGLWTKSRDFDWGD